MNQEGIPLENYEGFLEISVKQFVIQSSPTSIGQILRGL